jgi:hypothetical protein
MAQLPARLGDLIDHVVAQHPGGDPLVHLADASRAADQMGDLADHLVGHFVDQARRAGASWTEIGQSMGVTKQAVQQRFVPRAGHVEPDLFSDGRLSRFTLRARNVLVHAQQEARDAGNDSVQTTHLVLGLVDEPGGLAAQAIVAQGVAGDTVRAVLRAALGPAVEAVPAHVPFSADAKKLLGLTLREALRLGHNYIGTEHILLALLGDEQTPGGALLGALGVERVATEAWLAEAFEALAQQRHR